MTDVVSATRSYERWMASHTAVIQSDLALKHQRMSESPFVFLRATFYRWVELFPRVCSDLMDSPHLTTIGDLHIENFGTWRDREGRLVWGVNDLDEASTLPYVNDLVRLAASVALAIDEGHLRLRFREACEARPRPEAILGKDPGAAARDPRVSGCGPRARTGVAR